MSVCLSVSICIYVYVCVCKCMYACMYVCICLCVSVCVCACMLEVILRWCSSDADAVHFFFQHTSINQSITSKAEKLAISQLSSYSSDAQRPSGIPQTPRNWLCPRKILLRSNGTFGRYDLAWDCRLLRDALMWIIAKEGPFLFFCLFSGSRIKQFLFSATKSLPGMLFCHWGQKQ